MADRYTKKHETSSSSKRIPVYRENLLISVSVPVRLRALAKHKSKKKLLKYKAVNFPKLGD